MAEAEVAQQRPVSRRRWFGFAIAAMLLAGCGSTGGETAVCPVTGVLDYAGTLTRFAEAAGRDPASMALEVRIVDIGTTCRVEEGRGVVDMRVAFQATRGPASTDRSAAFSYFVAISGPDGQILARESFNVTLDFPADRAQTALADELVQTIPLAPGSLLSDYRVYVGLQLTEAELDYNQQLRPR